MGIDEAQTGIELGRDRVHHHLKRDSPVNILRPPRVREPREPLKEETTHNAWGIINR
jgi:hypothetical protein